MYLTNADQMREADRMMVEDFAFPGLILMENAGRMAATRILQLYPDAPRFIILCGKGKNGGDGMVVARHLHLAGKGVTLLLAWPMSELTEEVLANFGILLRLGIQILNFHPDIRKEIGSTEGAVIIDALLGTGTQGPVQDPVASILTIFRTIRCPVVALDLPSGLSADTGALNFSPTATLTGPGAPLKAEYTLTFQNPKYCHYITPAAGYCGKVEVLDIGIYPQILEKLHLNGHLIGDEMIRDWYKPRQTDSHKGTYGHVLMAGGSKGKGGAIALSTLASLEIGVGLATSFIPGAVACSFHRNTLENMSIPYGTANTSFLNETAAEVFGTYLAGKEAIGIGPGLGNTPDTVKFLQNVIPQINTPLILDADALNILAENPYLWEILPPDTVITPHPGEMARLMKVQTVQDKRMENARKLAFERKVIVVLKGAGTIIAAPDGQIFVCPTGNPGMATGGSGDVLTGAIAGLVAQGYPLLQAAVMGVYIHAVAGDIVADEYGTEGVTSTKIIRFLGRAFRKVVTGI